MFKNFLLALVLSLALVFSAQAADIGQECTIHQGSKIIQVMPDNSLRGIIVPEDSNVKVVKKLSVDWVEKLNNITDIDWEGSNIVILQYDFGAGPVPLVLIIPANSLDCE